MKYSCLHCGKEATASYQKENRYCSNVCQALFQSKEKLEEWKKTGITGRKSSSGTPPWLKRYILDKQGGKCAECGISSWNNKPLTLDLEHKDGNSDNNLEDNLCCLCPNCHSQTPTYKAKNKGSGRKHRKT